MLLVAWVPAVAADAVPPIAPKPIWSRFLVLVWQYKTSAPEDLPLYRRVGLEGFHIDCGAGKAAIVKFARREGLPYYVDHAADKGLLHLTDRTGRSKVLRRPGLVARPHSLADPRTMDLLKGHLARNVAATRGGPVVAYAFDDEVSLGVFTSPVEVDASPPSVAAYRRWLAAEYGTIAHLNRTWGTDLARFADAAPVSFEDVRRAHTAPPFARWNLARWMDWRSYMDTQFAGTLAELVRYTNGLDPSTPAGIVGSQQPAPYGGYDYAKLAGALQWIEAYDIGGTCEVLRSLWGRERRPYVQTWFSSGDARRDAWFLWYYLLHGNRGVIAWPARGDKGWFDWGEPGRLAPFLVDLAPTLREVQGPVSEAILGPDVRFDPDPIALLYSHPSVQASWVMDVVTHGRTWPNRSSSLDNSCQSAGRNRVAWMKLLEDSGFQFEIVTADQVATGELERGGTRVLILNRAIALADDEADAVRRFVAGGGTVIADHLTGVLDARGVGRPRGVLDDLFGIRRDEGPGYLDGRHITEIDGEKYRAPFLERLSYDGALRHEGMVVYERGTRAAGGRAGARAGSADVVIRRRPGGGRAVYLNLTPLAYVDHGLRLSETGERWRKLLTTLLAESSLVPRARVIADEALVPLAELLYWRRGETTVLGLIKNASRHAEMDGDGAVHGMTGEPRDVEIVLAEPFTKGRNLRTGEDLPPGRTIRATWNPWEALLFELSR